jgi:hypothetical protein
MRGKGQKCIAEQCRNDLHSTSSSLRCASHDTTSCPSVARRWEGLGEYQGGGVGVELGVEGKNTLRLPVLASAHGRSWPKHGERAEGVSYREVGEVFSTRYGTDAHTTAYSVPSVPHRLSLEGLGQLPGGWAMVLFHVDVDAPGHGQHKPTSPAEQAALALVREQWWQGMQPRLLELDQAHPGAFLYRSRSGGFHLVWRLPCPVVIHTAEEKEAWRRWYQRSLLYLARAFGIEGDPAQDAITALFRLPFVTREGSAGPAEAETRGNPHELGVWEYEPGAETAEDQAICRELVARGTSARWPSVLAGLVPRAARRSPVAGVGSGPRAVRERKPAPVLPEAREEDHELVAALGARTSAGWRPGGRDAAARALGGTLGALGYEPARVRALVSQAAHLAGAEDAAGMGEKALRTAHLAAAGKPAWQARRLREMFPELSTVLREHLASAEASPPETRAGLVTAAEGAARVRGLVGEAFGAPGITAIVATPGLGKSQAVREALAARGEGAVYCVPNHELAGQTTAELVRVGLLATHPVGVVSVRKLPLLSHAACQREEDVSAMIAAGAQARRDICPTCPHLATCVPTQRKADPKAHVWVHQSAIAAGVLGQAAAKLRQGLLPGAEGPSPARLAILDEPPAVVEHLALPAVGGPLGAYTLAKARGELTDEARELLGPVVEGLSEALRSPNLGPRSLRELLGPRDDAEQVLRELTEGRSVGAMRAAILAGAIEGLAKEAKAPQHRATLARIEAVEALGRALVEAAHRPDAPCLFWLAPHGEHAGGYQLTTRAPWVRAALEFCAAGGSVVVLDATANASALGAVVGEGLRVERVDVEDAPGTRRLWARWASGARSRHVGPEQEPDPRQLRGALRRIAEQTRRCGARSVGILAHKAVHEGLERAIEQVRGGSGVTPLLLPAEFVRLLGPREDGSPGVEFVLGHFGAQRGLDRWKECELLVTLGDPHPNLGAVTAEALALGVDPQAYADHQAGAELVQAWGRARAVHRQVPGVILHVGNLAPSGELAPQWSGAGPSFAPPGRPRATGRDGVPLDPSTWASERERLGLSARGHARHLGVEWASYWRAEAYGGDFTGEPNSSGLVVAHYSDGEEREPERGAEETCPKNPFCGIMNHADPLEFGCGVPPPLLGPLEGVSPPVCGGVEPATEGGSPPVTPPQGVVSDLAVREEAVPEREGGEVASKRRGLPMSRARWDGRDGGTEGLANLPVLWARGGRSVVPWSSSAGSPAKPGMLVGSAGALHGAWAVVLCVCVAWKAVAVAHRCETRGQEGRCSLVTRGEGRSGPGCCARVAARARWAVGVGEFPPLPGVGPALARVALPNHGTSWPPRQLVGGGRVA